MGCGVPHRPHLLPVVTIVNSRGRLYHAMGMHLLAPVHIGNCVNHDYGGGLRCSSMPFNVVIYTPEPGRSFV